MMKACGSARWMGFALACVLTLWHGKVRAQKCDRSCADELRDAYGCCPPPKPTPPPQPPPPPPKPVECPDGKAISSDTSGHCCWAGQVWSSGRCVGIPTSCPEPRIVANQEQECMLPQCPAGMLRGADKAHCCWPGQAWSKSRQVCVGFPNCPKGFEVDGEGCVSDDKDNDGIPNALDKCPTQPEDKNGFEDEDGCPDEDRRLAALAEVERKRADAERAAGQEAKARADKEAAELEAKRKADAAALEARKKAEAEAKKQADDAARRKREWEEAAEAERQQRERWVADAPYRFRRRVGYLVGAGGLVSGVVSFVFMGLGASENGKIRGGNLPSVMAVENAASSGHTDNAMAIGFGIVGIVGVGTGIGLLVAGVSPAASAGATKSEQPSVSFSPGGRGVIATLHF
jgi:hypothetical protein